jgi:hypothetical protein
MTKEQEEDLGFRVTDKRAFRAEATPQQDTAPQEPEKGNKSELPNVVEDNASNEQRQADPGTSIRIDFPAYVLSYYSQGLVLLGEVPHPQTNKNEEDLEGAQHMVDILAMLQEKTKGNLTKEENQLLDSVLYELRMRFMAKTKRIKL